MQFQTPVEVNQLKMETIREEQIIHLVLIEMYKRAIILLVEAAKSWV